MNKLVKEVCVESISEAKKSEALGATQIELCGRLDLDGLTPDLKLVQEALEELSIHTKVMVRPRGGSFVSSEEEVDVMAVTIESLKNMEVRKIVFGLLTDQKRIDVQATKKLADLAQPMKVTFHKAIDELEDPVEGVKQLLGTNGITGILTSGGKSTAREGARVIAKMKEAANDRIQIIAAGKITSNNLEAIDELIGADAYHGKLIVDTLK